MVDSKAAVQSLLGCKVRCTLNDGRVATGRLVCLDRMRNMILTDCVEERWIDSIDYNNNDGNTVNHRKKVIRRLQQAMVPGQFLQQVQIESKLHEKAVVPHL
mmetsp:Transcript_18865/g.24273  ORF Transcript_18865/g.24273 Transcript_18865/m.24273 type:complete len:102 (+) Transcript_18865:79-384(+)